MLQRRYIRNKVLNRGYYSGFAIRYNARTPSMFPLPQRPMDYFTKPHLPLISPRIKFQRNSLPPRPNITQRLNLDQRIRRADRVRFSATTPRHKSKEPGTSSLRNPAGTSTPAPASDSLSDLSELSDENSDEDYSETEDASSSTTIAKPPGAIGRKSGGYNLEDALNWDGGKYKRLIDWLNTKIQSKLDSTKSFKYQDQKTLNELILEGTRKFGIEGMYDNNWPVREGFKMRLKTTSESWKRKGKGNADKNLRRTLAAVIDQSKS